MATLRPFNLKDRIKHPNWRKGLVAMSSVFVVYQIVRVIL